MNNFTRGGAKLFQMKLALGSVPCPLALIILYKALESRLLSGLRNAEVLLSGAKDSEV
jgi:hypothetical protein